MNNVLVDVKEVNDMKYAILKEFLDNCGCKYERDVDLKKKTWIHRGGTANFFITPTSITELETLCSFLYRQEFEFHTIGQTSNLYIKNECNINVIVSTIKCQDFSFDGDCIYCDCGLSVAKLSRNAIRQGIKGFEQLTSLPGTIGGAIFNNSSCGSNSISSLIDRVFYIDEYGNEQELKYEDFHFDFRISDFKRYVKKGVITRVYLKKQFGNRETLEKVSQENDLWRKNNIDGPQNLGCTVHKCFCNGKMPLRFRIPYGLSVRLISLIIKNPARRNKLLKQFILRITHNSNLAPYISDKSMIIYQWIDDGADVLFPQYLSFMKTIFKTDKVEIEIIG